MAQNYFDMNIIRAVLPQHCMVAKEVLLFLVVVPGNTMHGTDMIFNLSTSCLVPSCYSPLLFAGMVCLNVDGIHDILSDSL